MKAFYISLAIIILLISIWGFVFNIITTTTYTLNAYLDNMEDKINNDNWKDSEKILNTIENEWTNKLRILILIITHDEIEKINLSLKRLNKYLFSKDKPLVLGELASLRFSINHIKEREALSFRNIF